MGECEKCVCVKVMVVVVAIKQQKSQLREKNNVSCFSILLRGKDAIIMCKGLRRRSSSSSSGAANKKNKK